MQHIDSKYSAGLIGIIGGCGHIGLPLAVAFCERGFRVVAIDRDELAVEKVKKGEFPFFEADSEGRLADAIGSQRFRTTSEISAIADCEIIVVCVGTPVDEHLSPVPRIFLELIEEMKPFLSKGQLLVLRSTIFPGTTRLLERQLAPFGIDISFCPERIVQGRAFEEIYNLPHIVSGISKQGIDRASKLFETLGVVVRGEIETAEFAKLFLNAYRYIQFAATNEFFTIANDANVDYSEVVRLMKTDYPRAEGLPGAGFSAGPCLVKDTLQLVAYSQNRFAMGSAAFQVNEGLAQYVVKEISRKIDLSDSVIGLLGMAFKPGIDDIRSSLSYRVKKTLILQGAEVLCSDSQVTMDKTLLKLEEVIERADLLILCTPQTELKSADYLGKPVIDIWNYLGNGNLISNAFEPK